MQTEGTEEEVAEILVEELGMEVEKLDEGEEEGAGTLKALVSIEFLN